MTTFNKVTLGNIRLDINAALATVAKKHGIDLGIGNISFTDSTFTTKITANNGAVTKSNSASKIPGTVAMHSAFMKNAYMLGFKPDDLGKTVMYQGTKWVLCGARPRARLALVLWNGIAGKFIAVSETAVKVA